ncbi:MAG: uncharacterized protein QOE35_711 [Actinomycetota bacterium]|jgi:predicted RNA-binding protein YlqC (UPF0109 family)
MSDVTGDETAEPTDEAADDAADAGAPDAAMSRAVLEYLANAIVDEPDGVVVEVEERRNGVELSLHVAPDDMGKIIGRRGRVAQAIRTVVRAAGAKEGIEAQVEIVD